MSRCRLFAVVLAVLPAVGAVARGDSLGVANDYNVFVLHDMTQSGTDAQGKIAVGHNASLSSFSAASSLGSSSTNLIVGNTWTQASGGTVNGTALVNGNANVDSPTVTGALRVNGTLTNTGYGGPPPGGTYYGVAYSGPSYFNPVQGTTPLPFSFADAATYLTDHSTFWGSLAATGTTVQNGGNVDLTGSSTTLNVFSVPASYLTGGISLNISAPAGSTALINITGGTSITLSNFGIALSGIDAEHILYNLPTATSVSLSSIGVKGSLLAPNAAVQFNSGNIDGTLVAYDLTGQGESHLHLFRGDIPYTPTLPGPPPSVPTPAAITAGAGLLAFLGALRWFRRSR